MLLAMRARRRQPVRHAVPSTTIWNRARHAAVHPSRAGSARVIIGPCLHAGALVRIRACPSTATPARGGPGLAAEQFVAAFVLRPARAPLVHFAHP
jgi:hypothetical protein